MAEKKYLKCKLQFYLDFSFFSTMQTIRRTINGAIYENDVYLQKQL